MITTIEAIAIAKKYLSDKGWEYLYVVEDKIWFDTNQKIPHGKYEDQIKNTCTVTFHIEGYQYPESRYIEIDSDTGEVLFTITGHGYLDA